MKFGMVVPLGVWTNNYEEFSIFPKIAYFTGVQIWAFMREAFL
jgi:hypothetical protein